MGTPNQKYEDPPSGRSAELTRHAARRREPQKEKVNDHEQLLIDAMRDLGWGRIENVPIRGGIPRMTKDTKVLRLVRVGGSEPALKSCWHYRKPHQQHQKLFADCKGIGDGGLERIEVSDGLPIYWKQA